MGANKRSPTPGCGHWSIFVLIWLALYWAFYTLLSAPNEVQEENPKRTSQEDLVRRQQAYQLDHTSTLRTSQGLTLLRIVPTTSSQHVEASDAALSSSAPKQSFDEALHPRSRPTSSGRGNARETNQDFPPTRSQARRLVAPYSVFPVTQSFPRPMNSNDDKDSSPESRLLERPIGWFWLTLILIVALAVMQSALSKLCATFHKKRPELGYLYSFDSEATEEDGLLYTQTLGEIGYGSFTSDHWTGNYFDKFDV